MANPFQGNFDDLSKALGEGLDVINKAAAEGQRKVVEAQRTGQRLRIPAPNEPVVGARPSPAIESALRAETNAHRSLSEAIRRHEEALHRLNALKRQQKADPNNDALNAEIARLKQERTRLGRDVGLKQQALANVAFQGDPTQAKTYADAQRKALRSEVRSVEVAETAKTDVVARETAKRKRAQAPQARYAIGQRFSAEDRRPVAVDPVRAALGDFEKSLMRFARMVDLEAATDVRPGSPRSQTTLTSLQRGSLTRMMEGALRQTFGQTWEPPAPHVRERERQASERYGLRQRLGGSTAEGSRLLGDRAAEETDRRALQASERIAALRGQATQADRGRLLAQRIYQQELDDEVRAREEGLRLQRAALDRQRASYDFANRPIRERLTPDQAAQDEMYRRITPPPPPPPPPPPTAPPPPPPPPPPVPGRRSLFGHEMLAKDEVERIYAGTKNAEIAVNDYEEALGRAQKVELGHAEAMRASSVEASRAVTQFGALTQEYRRHGAATTEFLTALGRGRASVSEIGWQALATAGKFGAWTAASGLVFGALAAVGRAGSGAIESMSGINELSRYISGLDTSRAQRQFRALADEFNLPIGEVTTAFAQMGRVFGDQEQAMEGARAVLLATRVGELEVADSARFLSAIFQGFQIPASQTTTVIDQINSAQNNLNFSIRDGAAGIARAAGTWRAAGGTFSELLAIMATAQRATGASGEVVGTAFRRSAEFIGREHNQAQLRSFGIDPTTGVDQVYRQAFSAVESGRVQGQDVTRLAAALSSPQLAAVISPTLQSFERYHQAIRQTNAEAAKGSARNELAIQLDAVRERLAAVGVNLEELGSNLAQSGVLNGLGLMLTTLNLSLEAANNIAEVFNHLPTGVRTALTAWLQIYAAVRLLRRLNVGEALTESAANNPDRRRRRNLGVLGQFVSGDPNRQAFNRLRADLSREQDYARGVSEDYGRRTAGLSVQAQAAQRRVDDLRAQGPDRSIPNRAAAERHYAQAVIAAQHEATAIDRERAIAAREELAASERLAAIKKRNLIIEQTGRQYGPRAGLEAAQGAGIRVPVAGFIDDDERPSGQRVVTPVGRQVVSPRGVILPAAAAAELTEAVAAGGAVAAGEIEAAMLRGGAKAGAAEALGDLGAAGAGAGAAGARTSGKLAAAKAGVRSAATGIRGVALGIGGLFGPLEIALVGLIALPEIIGHFQEQDRKRRESLRRLRTPALDPATYQAQQQEARDVGGEAELRRRALADEQRRGLRPVAPGAVPGGRGWPTTARAQQGANDLAAEMRRQAEQRGARARGEAVPLQFLDDLDKQLSDDLTELQRNGASRGEVNRLWQRYYTAAQQSMESRRGGAEGVQQRETFLANARQQFATLLDPSDAFDRLEHLPLGQVAEQVERVSGAVETFGVTRNRLRTVVSGYITAFEQLGGRSNPELIEEFDRAQAAMESAVEQITSSFTRDLGRQTTERGQRHALNTALGRIRSQVNQARDDQRARVGQVRAAQRARDRAEAALEAANRATQASGPGARPGRQGRFSQRLLGNLGDFGFGQTAASDRDKLRAALGRAERNLEKELSEEKISSKAFRRAMGLLRDARRDIVGSFLESFSTRVEAEANFKNSQTTDEGQRAANNTAAKRQIAQEYAKRYERGQIKRVDYLNAQAEANNAALEEQEQAVSDVSEHLSLMESRNRLAVARAPESAKGAVLLAGLQQRLAYARSHGAEEETINGLQADIIDQQTQNVEDARQRERDNIQSLYDLRRSLTDSPVRRARLDQEEAEALSKVGGDRNQRRQDRAAVNERRRTRYETRHDREIEDAELYKDIGRIGDQQLIAIYERAIRDRRTGANYRRELKHRLLRLKHDLNQESALDLNVGNVGLPTTYEIRRFMGGGGGGSVVQQTTVTAPISISGVSNPEAIATTVVDHINRKLTTTGKASARAARRRP